MIAHRSDELGIKTIYQCNCLYSVFIRDLARIIIGLGVYQFTVGIDYSGTKQTTVTVEPVQVLKLLVNLRLLFKYE